MLRKKIADNTTALCLRGPFHLQLISTYGETKHIEDRQISLFSILYFLYITDCEIHHNYLLVSEKKISDPLLIFADSYPAHDTARSSTHSRIQSSLPKNT